MGVTVSETVAHLRRLDEGRAEEARARRAALEALLPRAHEILLRLGATRVWVFGSVVSGDTHAASDLDLATEGLPSERYFEALGALMCELPCPIDLVRLEEAPDSLRARVLHEGRAL